MTRIWRASLRPLLLLAPLACLAQSSAPKLTGFPFGDESLSFRVAGPSGVSLGSGRMSARRVEGGQWEFQLTLDVSVPGLPVKDSYRSLATSNLCSVEFERDSAHGPRKSLESVRFDPEKNKATRTTRNGGSSEFNVAPCARDALAYLYFARFEMGQGRVPPSSNVVFGGPYDVRPVYTGEQPVKGAAADRLAVNVRGPASNLDFDILLARDAARTPVSMSLRTPLALGTLSMELTR
ncbi:MAG TPA: DUF3108 domain-containing protein [Bryobacteraceae bacterium]|jgi:hypothetical protein|nr:DUF3108 domain-containing protein [Bryobacteraceae bacterium]